MLQLPQYARHSPAVPLTATYDLGSHVLEIAADQSISLVDHAAYEEGTDYTASETVSLNSDEVYRLLMILHTLFQ